jgi:hypothetical protein
MASKRATLPSRSRRSENSSGRRLPAATGWNGRFGKHSGPSQGDPCRRAFRPLATFQRRKPIVRPWRARLSVLAPSRSAAPFGHVAVRAGAVDRKREGTGSNHRDPLRRRRPVDRRRGVATLVRLSGRYALSRTDAASCACGGAGQAGVSVARACRPRANDQRALMARSYRPRSVASFSFVENTSPDIPARAAPSMLSGLSSTMTLSLGAEDSLRSAIS